MLLIIILLFYFIYMTVANHPRRWKNALIFVHTDIYQHRYKFDSILPNTFSTVRPSIFEYSVISPSLDDVRGVKLPAPSNLILPYSSSWILEKLSIILNWFDVEFFFILFFFFITMYYSMGEIFIFIWYNIVALEGVCTQLNFCRHTC